MPRNFDRYVVTEVPAYEEKMGIWSIYSSRQRYLKRLANEERTVYSRINRRYVTKLQKVKNGDFARYDKRFIKLAGRLEQRLEKALT